MLSRVTQLPGKRLCTAAYAGSNPLLADWTVTEPFGLPPWGKIKPEHFEPAFKDAMAEHVAELTAIATNSENPSFENTCAAFDRAGPVLEQVQLCVPS